MKNRSTLTIIACAMLAANTNAHAAPNNTNRRAAQVHAMCQNKDTRIMMIRGLMNTKEGRQELAAMLEHDAEFRSYYETHSVNPG